MDCISKLNQLLGEGFNNIVAITVPNTFDVVKKIDTSIYVKSVAEELSSYFGGATAQTVKGYWISNDIGLVEEEPVRVYSYCDSDTLNDKIENVVSLCRDLKNRLRQESIALEINGVMYFV